MKKKFKDVLSSYMESVPDVHIPCDRCLKTERWDSSVVCMVIDAAFTSIGLNYFTSVVPAVERFRKTYAEPGIIKNCSDFAAVPLAELKMIWKNERSWNTAQKISSYLAEQENDRIALRTWARTADPSGLANDPIGRVKGVGINTFQYLRMMGGVDTVMPDKIVKRVIFEIIDQSGASKPESDIDFITFLEETAPLCGYRPIEVCWMTWLVQSEGDRVRSDKYKDILGRI
jgi:hypothetical protein